MSKASGPSSSIPKKRPARSVDRAARPFGGTGPVESAWIDLATLSEQRGADTVFKHVTLIGNAKVLITGVEPRRELPPHCHETEAQFYFAIEGEGVVRIGDREFPLRPGIAVTVAPGEVHGVRNPGDQMVRYIDILFGASS